MQSTVVGPVARLADTDWSTIIDQSDIHGLVDMEANVPPQISIGLEGGVGIGCMPSLQDENDRGIHVVVTAYNFNQVPPSDFANEAEPPITPNERKQMVELMESVKEQALKELSHLPMQLTWMSPFKLLLRSESEWCLVALTKDFWSE